jgi:hypothetical protein
VVVILKLVKGTLMSTFARPYPSHSGDPSNGPEEEPFDARPKAGVRIGRDNFSFENLVTEVKRHPDQVRQLLKEMAFAYMEFRDLCKEMGADPENLCKVLHKEANDVS